MSLQDTLDIALSGEERKVVADLLATNGGSITKVVESLNSSPTISLSKESLSRVDLLGKLEILTKKNYSIIKDILKIEGTPERQIIHMADVAFLYESLSTMDSSKGAPGTIEELKSHLFRLEPTAVLASMVHSGAIPVDTSCKPVLETILRTCMDNGLQITSTPISKIMPVVKSMDNSSAPIGVAFQILKDMQRLQAIIMKPEHLAMLMKCLSEPDRSARKISLMGYKSFSSNMKNSGLSEDEMKKIFNNAYTIHVRNEQIWAAILASKTQPLQPAVRKAEMEEYKRAEALKSSQPSGNLDRVLVNYGSLFNETETVECEDCDSVLSAGAYFVDLMQTLDAITVRKAVIVAGKTIKPRLSLFGRLKERRSDLESIAITCANTKGLLPYVDVVNEVLECFISSNMQSSALVAYNTPEGLNANSRPEARVDLTVYEKSIQPLVHPMTAFPYNYGVDCMRKYLSAAGTSFSELRSSSSSPQRVMRKLSSDNTLNRKDEVSLQQLQSQCEIMIQRASAAESLNLQEEDFIAITKESFIPIGLKRLTSGPDTTLTPEKYEQTISKYLGAAAYWGYTGKEGESLMLDIKDGKGLAYIRRQLLERSGLSPEELIQILKTRFIGGRLIITAADGCNLLTGKLDEMRLRSSVLISDDGILDSNICGELQAFIRLRKQTDWNVTTLDAALGCAASLHNHTRTGISADYIVDLANIKELADLTGLEISAILGLWSDLDTNGPTSIYTKLFLRRRWPNATTSPFALQTGQQSYLPQDTAITLSVAQAELEAGLRATKDDVAKIQAAVGLNNDSKLTLSNVSMLYRGLIMCKILGIKAAEYKAFLNAFGSPSRDIFETPAETLRIVKDYFLLLDAGWKLSELSSILGSDDQILDQKVQDAALKLALSMVNAVKSVNSTWQKSSAGVEYSSKDVEKVSLALFDASIAGEITSFIEGTLQTRLNFDETKVSFKGRKIMDTLPGKTMIKQNEIILTGQLSETEHEALILLETNKTALDKYWAPLLNNLMRKSAASIDILTSKLPGKDRRFDDWPLLTAVDYQKGMSTAAAEETISQRRSRYIEIGTAQLRKSQLEQQLINLMKTAFPGVDDSIIKYLFSNIDYDLDTESSAKNNATLFSKLVNRLSRFPVIPEANVGGYLLPVATEKYIFILPSDQDSQTPEISVNGVQLKPTSNETTDEDGSSEWVSEDLTLLAGKSYRLNHKGSLQDLSWGSQSSKASPIDPSLYVDRLVVEAVFETYSYLNKLQSILKRASLSLEELQFMILDPPQDDTTKTSKDGLKVENLSISTLLQLTNFSNLHRTFQVDGQSRLLQLLKWLNLPEDQQKSSSLTSELSKASCWSAARWKELMDAKYPLDTSPPNSSGSSSNGNLKLIKRFRSIDELTRLQQTVDYITRLTYFGSNLEEAMTWAEPPTSTESISKAAKTVIEKSRMQNAGENTVGSKLTDSLGSLRENRRRALVTYLLNTSWATENKIALSDQLFEYFLIDVNMGPELETTRIRQAISTIQLYVQRCFLGAEALKGVTPDIIEQLAPKWEYMRKQNLWEANRKVFLYPENWADPTIRDNKSDQFKALESQILQIDLNEKSITDLIKSYIFDTNLIAYLDIQAYLWERNGSDKGRFHFFGRTRTAPRLFYYRKMEISEMGAPIWYPWSKLELDIPTQSVDSDNSVQHKASTYMVPAVVRGRLYLFIPEITFKKTPINLPKNQTIYEQATTKPTDTPKATNGSWEIKIGWSEKRKDEKWSPKMFSADILSIAATNPPRLQDFKFKVRARKPVADPDGFLDAFATYEDGITDILLIDIESQNGTTPYYHGQFELKDSQLYLVKPGDVYSPYKDVSSPKTFTTSFAKVQFQVEAAAKVTLPDLEFSENRLITEKTLDANDKVVIKRKLESVVTDPLLVDYTSTEKRSITWTLSYDATQYQRPIGLVVDIDTTTAGPQTYFARPPQNDIPLSDKASKKFSETLNVMPLDHRCTNALMEAAARSDKPEDLYKALSDAITKQGYTSSGLYLEKIYHEHHTPFSLYNWELGVHVISLLMERLFATQQLDLALRVARLLFDPTKDGANLHTCWSFPPFSDQGEAKLGVESTQELLKAQKPELDDYGNRKPTLFDLAAEEWRRNPFNAHSVARGRPVTYMKRIVVKYIEILVAMGDLLFRQRSMDSLPLAIQRYIEASYVMGPALRPVKQLGKRQHKSYKDLSSILVGFGNAGFDLELEFPFSCLQKGKSTSEEKATDQKGLLGFVAASYFCVPTNPRLKELRGLIDDRLTKIRNCQDIDGNAMRLPLSDPPIDPGALVNAAASGQLSSALLLNDMDAPLPNYRFAYLLGKAFEITAELKGMGESFLSIKEKRDGEALSLLKAQHDSILQKMTLDIKTAQKEEALQAIDALLVTRSAHEMRLRYYLALIGDDDIPTPNSNQEWTDIQQDIDKPSKKDELRMSKNETLEMVKSESASRLSFNASIIETTASALLAVPNLMENLQPVGMGATIKFDAANIAQCMMGVASVMKLGSEMESMEAQRASRKAQMIRQLQDRRLQANMAARDIKGVDKQIEGSKKRVDICDAEIRMQQTSYQQSLQTHEWYKSKYTNEELYAWMESRTRTIFYNTYTLAIDLAKKAEKAFAFEKGKVGDSVSFLQKQSYWDSARDGLFAAQDLYLSLKRMELAHINDTTNPFEITKNISLRQLNPIALFNLRMKGEAVFSIPEIVFDFDFPGHYFRRIKSVSITIPCIVGPYTNLNCTLSLLENRYRVSSLVANGEYAETSDRDERFRTNRVPITSIAVSNGQSDTGRFEMNFNSERYMPFENAGVISRWKLELPSEFRQFDYDTISDVVLQFRYTAEQGGARLKQEAINSIRKYVSVASDISNSDEGTWALLDVRSDFSTQFGGLSNTTTSKPKVAELSQITERLPFWTRGLKPQVSDITVLLHSSSVTDKAHGSEILFTFPDVGEPSSFIGTFVDKGWTSYRYQKPADSGIHLEPITVDKPWKMSIQPLVAGTPMAGFDRVLLIFRYQIQAQSGRR